MKPKSRLDLKTLFYNLVASPSSKATPIIKKAIFKKPSTCRAISRNLNTDIPQLGSGSKGIISNNG